MVNFFVRFQVPQQQLTSVSQQQWSAAVPTNSEKLVTRNVRRNVVLLDQTPVVSKSTVQYVQPQLTTKTVATKVSNPLGK